MKIKKLIEIFIVLSLISVSKVYAKTSLTSYFDTDNTQAMDFKFIVGQFKFAHRDGKTNFGIAAFSDSIAKNIAFKLLFGNLSISSSISKLNNPLLSSSSSAFSSGFSSIDSITARFPATNSFSNDFSTFLQFGNLMKKDALLFWKLNCFYSPEEDKKGFSIFLNKNLFKNKLKLSGQFSLGIFPYEENSISSWFTDQLYYHEGNHLCANYQLSIECGKFQTSFLQGLYENPFSSISSIYRSDSKFSTDRFTFTLSALYNPNTRENTIITSSDKVIKNCMQFRSSLQYKYRCGKSFPIFIKNALASYLNLNLEESQQDLKFSAASQFICPFTSTSLLVNVNANLNTENPYSPSYDFDSATIKLQSSAYIKDFSPGITASITLNPSQSFDSLSISSKFGLNISYSKFPKISGNASISLNHKDGELSSRKLSASLKASFSFKFINVILKFSADTNI